MNERLRKLVRTRAKGCCEYCISPAEFSSDPFSIEHNTENKRCIHCCGSLQTSIVFQVWHRTGMLLVKKARWREIERGGAKTRRGEIFREAIVGRVMIFLMYQSPL